MRMKKFMAAALAATMLVGNGAVAFAADSDPANGATGTGTAFDHVNKEITSVTLPTAGEVANVFNYYVDPEGLIDSAGSLADGTAVTGNSDGVYFPHAGAAAVPATNASVTAFSIDGKSEADDDVTVTVPNETTATTLTYQTINDDSADADGWYNGSDEFSGVSITGTVGATLTPASGDTITVSPYQAGQAAGSTTYTASSDAVSFEGKNSVDVDVSVTAAVTATAGDKDITLVADDDALDKATAPALLMKLKVGSDEKAITSAGATAKAKIEGKSSNFAVTAESGEFVYKIRTDTDTSNGGTALDAWDSTTVQLVGKTNNKTVPEGMTAPKITLTWTVAKHSDAPATPATPSSYLSTNKVTGSNNAITLSLPSGVTVTGVDLYKVGATSATSLVSGNTYTVSGTTLTIKNTVVNNNTGAKATVKFSDEHTEDVTFE